MDTFHFVSALRRDGAILPREEAVQLAEGYVAAFAPCELGTRVMMFRNFRMVYTQVMDTDSQAQSFAWRFPETWKKVTWGR